MRSRHIPMSPEEFDLLPFELGWKQEYCDGMAHFTPRLCVVHASIPARPRMTKTSVIARAVQESDEAELVRCFQKAFADTFEYCDEEPERIEVAARQCVRHFFKGLFHRCLPASRVAVAPPNDVQAGAVIGAALVISRTKERDWALLDMIFVTPEWRRHGVATALTSAVLSELHASGWGTLVSRYQMGNEASRAWHRRFGFADEPDLQPARLHLHAAERELWRRKKLGTLTREDEQILSDERARWSRAVECLERALVEGREEEAFAWRRFSAKPRT
jgi:GNAT superfamily N-acetyltransferase